MATVEKDPVTGMETTGHEWDGIKELNTPLPRWWLYTFYACILWSFGYWIVYPSWPTFSDYAHGVIGYSSRAELDKDMAAARKAQESWRVRLAAADIEAIVRQGPDRLRRTAAPVRCSENCPALPWRGRRGTGGRLSGAGRRRLDLGGTPGEILNTVRVGIRSGTRTRASARCPFSDQLKAPEIAGLADHVLSLSRQGRPERRRRQVVRGAMPPVTAPTAVATRVGRAETRRRNLASRRDQGRRRRPDRQSRHGVMPTWEGRLDAVALRWSRPMSMRSVGASRPSAELKRGKGRNSGPLSDLLVYPDAMNETTAPVHEEPMYVSRVKIHRAVSPACSGP